MGWAWPLWLPGYAHAVYVMQFVWIKIESDPENHKTFRISISNNADAHISAALLLRNSWCVTWASQNKQLYVKRGLTLGVPFVMSDPYCPKATFTVVFP